MFTNGGHMPEDKPSAPTADEALSAWERGAGDTPDTPPHPKLAHLKSRFAAHTDVCSLEAVLSAAMNDAGDAVPVTVEVQPGLLALLAHIEKLDSARVGRNPAPPSRLLAQIVSNHLENLLHTIVTDPTSHPHYADLWNALCAAEGAPELAVPTDDAANGTPPADGGPF